MFSLFTDARSGQRSLRVSAPFSPGRVGFILFAFLILGLSRMHGQDGGLYWKYKDYDGAIAFTLPRWTTAMGSLFLDEKEERKLLRKVHKVRILFFQDNNPIKERDMKKFVRKAKRRQLEELVTVRSGKTRVHIMAKERRNAVRKLVVFFNTEDGSGLVTMKGKFKFDDLNKTLKKVQEKTKKDNKKPIVPDAVKIPVSRV